MSYRGRARVALRRGSVLRGGSALVMSGIVALSISACAPPLPEPTPSATVSGFASEEEAFRAAEATYRAYIDALNEVDLADPATFEPVYALLVGDALASLRRDFSQMHADGWAVGGSTTLEHAEVARESSRRVVYLLVCTDVHGVTLTDRRGRSQVSPERPDVHSLTIKVVKQDSGWAISEIHGRSGAPRCA